MAIRRTLGVLSALAVGLVLSAGTEVLAQGRGGRAGGPPPSGRAAAVEDLTGTWVSVVTEHWHLRMTVPPKGDFSMLPLTPEARKVAQSWNPAANESADDQCKGYGAPAIMRIPGRINLHWTDDNTLQLDTDAGTQTRVFHFNTTTPPANTPASWQGYSTASWVGAGGRGRASGEGGIGQLRVMTTRLRPGYLRKNGVPYSGATTVEEFYDRFEEPNGDSWLLVTIIVTDPQNLTQPYASTVHFKKIADRSGWDPTPCRSNEPR